METFQLMRALFFSARAGRLAARVIKTFASAAMIAAASPANVLPRRERDSNAARIAGPLIEFVGGGGHEKGERVLSSMAAAARCV